MDYSSFLTNDVFLTLKCDSCKNCLSYFPICISGDKKNICGRCSVHLPKGSYAQNEVYEALAQFVKFPCRYKGEGCLQNFLPKDVVYHEKGCTFQLTECPTNHFTKCDWKGPKSNSVYHCQDKHSDLILNDGELKLDLFQSYTRVSLLKHESSLFIVEEKFYSINKLMEFCIYNHKSDVDFQEFTCEVKFKTKTRSVTVECLVTGFEKKKIVEIFLDSLKDRENVSSTITGQLILLVEVPVEAVNKIDETLLAAFRCSFCLEYILPPIFSRRSINDSQNQLFCQGCRNKGSRHHTKEIREFPLEKLAELLNYPCRYNKNGCPFVGKPLQMEEHLKFCLFGIHVCPVSEYVACTWTGNGHDVVAHICKAHEAMILNSSTVTVNPLNCKENFNIIKPSIFSTASNSLTVSSPKCYIIKFSNHLFRLNFAEIEQCYYWAVQMIGPFQGDYMFELEIIDIKNNRNSLITKQPCTSLKKKDRVFIDKMCYFGQNQLANLTKEDQLTFKVHIYQESVNGSK